MKKCLYFVHVLKTGGTSVRKFFEEQNIGMDLYAGGVVDAGHNSYEKEVHDRLNKEYDKVITAICLRDPVKQIVSFYSYIKKHPTAVISATAKGKSFSKWIRSVPNFENFYIRFLNHKGFYDPNAIDNLRNTMCNYQYAKNILESLDYVISTPSLNDGMTKIFKENGINKKFKSFHNQSNSHLIKVSKEDIEYIKKIRSEDYKLLKEFNIKIEY